MIKLLINNILIVVILSVQFQYLNAQIYFDKLYGHSENSETSVSIGEVRQDGYMFIYFGDEPDGSGHMVIVNVNEEGDTLWTKRYQNGIKLYDAKKLLKVNPDRFLVSAIIRDSLGGRPYPMLMMLNDVGDSLWANTYSEFGPQSRDPSFDVTQTGDQGFAIIGQTTDSSYTDGDVYVIKTDSLGNESWRMTYGGTLFDAGLSILEAADQGLVLFGWTRSFGGGNRSLYLIKTDSLGNEEWYSTYGGAGYQTGWGLTQTVNGDYLMAGFNNNNGWVVRVDSNGELIWQNQFGEPGADQLYWAFECDDGNIIAAGLTTYQGSDDGLLVKISATGEEIWFRAYQKSDYTDLLAYVQPTTDHGFVACGTSRNELTFSPDAWLLKVDSLGCPYPNCTVGIDEKAPATIVADIYPNPASEQLHIAFQQPGNWQVKLFDMQGREVFGGRCTREVSYAIDVAGFPAGVYLLQLSDGESLVREKVVVR